MDGKVVRELGTKVQVRKAEIAVDGQRIRKERHVYFAVYKPKGYVSTNNDPSGRPRVLDLLPEIAQRVYTIGRLDEASTGLILLTNDGELANKLAHPKFGVEKIYKVVVAGNPSKEVLDQLTEGIWLAEGKVRAKRVRVVGKRGESTILEMVLAEGKNREVRRMLAKLGHKVMTLTRIAVGPISVKGLKAGEYRPLSAREIEMLERAAAGEFRSPAPDRDPRGRRDRPPAPSGPGAASAARRPPAGSPSTSRPAVGPRPRPARPSESAGRAEGAPPIRRDNATPPPTPRARHAQRDRDEAGPVRGAVPPRPPIKSRPPGPAPRRPVPEQDVVVPPVGDDAPAGKTRRRIIGLDLPSASRPMPKSKRPKPPKRSLGGGPKPTRKRPPKSDE
ncbi:MAG: pseudouridine synthase [Isosphaeraceae bacterium]|nr:pseudouridine synthase [Isosphaeraceae bacterium]